MISRDAVIRTLSRQGMRICQNSRGVIYVYSDSGMRKIKDIHKFFALRLFVGIEKAERASNGSLITLYNNRVAWLSQKEEYTMVCEEHNTMVPISWKIMQEEAKYPWEWCSRCQTVCPSPMSRGLYSLLPPTGFDPCRCKTSVHTKTCPCCQVSYCFGCMSDHWFRSPSIHTMSEVYKKDLVERLAVVSLSQANELGDYFQCFKKT